MRNYHQSIPDRSRPVLPTTASGVAQQGTCGNYAPVLPTTASGVAQQGTCGNYATAKHTVVKTRGVRVEEGE